MYYWSRGGGGSVAVTVTPDPVMNSNNALTPGMLSVKELIIFNVGKYGKDDAFVVAPEIFPMIIFLPES